MAVQLEWCRFADLDAASLYALLRLRAEVFVVEQHCVFNDLDGLDPMAWHLCVRDATGDAVGTARVFLPGQRLPPDAPASASLSGDNASIGRIVTAQSQRGTGLGRQIVHSALEFISDQCGVVPVRIGAQARLKSLYEEFGFVVAGPAYLEDGILHLPMRATTVAA